MRRGILVVCLALATAAGCGFHLRGSAPLPAALARPYVEAADRYSPLYEALIRQLRNAGAKPAPGADGATAVVHVLEDRTGRELLTVTADNKPGEYEVYYTVAYSASVGGAELLPKLELTLTRNYGYDETAVLAKEHEEQALRDALAEELASLMLRRLAAL